MTITIHISRRSAGLLLLAALLACPVWVLAGPVTVPHTFSAGTPASAAQVNANFGALAGAVNDNDQRIGAVMQRVATLEVNNGPLRSITVQSSALARGGDPVTYRHASGIYFRRGSAAVSMCLAAPADRSPGTEVVIRAHVVRGGGNQGGFGVYDLRAFAGSGSHVGADPAGIELVSGNPDYDSNGVDSIPRAAAWGFYQEFLVPGGGELEGNRWVIRVDPSGSEMTVDPSETFTLRCIEVIYRTR